MADENMFNQVSTEPAQQISVEALVGEGKKYKDVNELAKAYVNADRHIAELREKSDTRAAEMEAMREFIANQIGELKNNNPNVNNPQTPNVQREEHEPAPAPRTEVKEVDIDARIKEALKEKDLEDRKAKNAALTEEVVIERFGSKEKGLEAIQAKAAELGVSPQWIANMAFESPAAFFATMGIDRSATSKNSPASGSDVNTAALSKYNPGIKPGTKAYYDNLRKTNKAEYLSPATQMRLMHDALNNPDFYKP